MVLFEACKSTHTSGEWVDVTYQDRLTEQRVTGSFDISREIDLLILFKVTHLLYLIQQRDQFLQRKTLMDDPLLQILRQIVQKQPEKYQNPDDPERLGNLMIDFVQKVAEDCLSIECSDLTTAKSRN